MLNDSFHYDNNTLYCDQVPVQLLAEQCGTPLYVYSLRRLLANLARLRTSFAALKPHIHYSAKANANLAVLRALVGAGTGIDAVSGGEIFKALQAGASPKDIVYAGVGKTRQEIKYALEQGVGWFNVENLDELRIINDLSNILGEKVRVALRLNPEVSANTHRHIATGHGSAKFGLTAQVLADVLARQGDFPQLTFAGIHVHIGSQLHDALATQQAVEIALEVIAPYPDLRTVNIGGGLPVAYSDDDPMPDWAEFAAALAPLLRGYEVLLEPGRSLVADTGILVSELLYIKQQAGETFYIVDASMTELIRPALYEAHHTIVPLSHRDNGLNVVNVVGPVCETTDVLGRNLRLPLMETGDLLAMLTSGAYGMVMASNYNARPRPAEVIVHPDGETWQVVRSRETWEDLILHER